jgi:hypothetical protein
MAGYSQDQKSKEQRLGPLEIGGTETRGEPALDRGKQVAGLAALLLVTPQSSEAACGAQLK